MFPPVASNTLSPKGENDAIATRPSSGFLPLAAGRFDASQTRTDSSSDAVTNRAPSGETSASLIARVWPSYTANKDPLAASQSFRSRSPHDKSCDPFATKQQP